MTLRLRMGQVLCPGTPTEGSLWSVACPQQMCHLSGAWSLALSTGMGWAVSECLAVVMADRLHAAGPASRLPVPGPRAGDGPAGAKILAAPAAGRASATSRGRPAQAASSIPARQDERLRRAASAEQKVPGTAAAQQLPAEGPLGSSRTGLSSLRSAPTNSATSSWCGIIVS